MTSKLLVSAAVAFTIQAQPPQPAEIRRPKLSPLFIAMDIDRDGTLSAAEIRNAPAILKQFDRNGDGMLTEDEIRPRPQVYEGGSPDDLVKTLMAFDKNGDGKLSKNELPERMQGIFDRADIDHDGFLTSEEIRKTAAAQRDPNDREPLPPGGIMRNDPVATALDTNHDGVISADEMKNASTSILKLDTDHDGVLTQEEARPALPAQAVR